MEKYDISQKIVFKTGTYDFLSSKAENAINIRLLVLRCLLSMICPFPYKIGFLFSNVLFWIIGY